MDFVNYQTPSQEEIRQIEDDARVLRAQMIANLFSGLKARIFGAKAVAIPAE